MLSWLSVTWRWIFVLFPPPSCSSLPLSPSLAPSPSLPPSFSLLSLPASLPLPLTLLSLSASPLCPSLQEHAFESSQKYKEGKFIIELAHMIKDNGWD